MTERGEETVTGREESVRSAGAQAAPALTLTFGSHASAGAGLGGALIAAQMAAFSYDIARRELCVTPDGSVLFGPDRDGRIDRAGQSEIVAAFDAALPGRIVEVEFEAVWRDGTRHRIAARGRVVEDAPGTIHGVLREVTQRRRIEDALREAVRDKDTLLRDKDSLFRELNHRVKNSLQLVSSLLQIQGRSIREPGLRRPIDDACGRVIAIARVHERLYRGDLADRLDFGAYLRNFCRELATGFGRPDAVGVSLAVEDLEIAVDQAVPLGLMAHELLTNALKYAYPDRRNGPIRVALWREADGGTALCVADEGVGLPDGFDPAEDQGMGMRLMKALLSQLQAELSIERRSPGVAFTVRVPPRPPTPA